MKRRLDTDIQVSDARAEVEKRRTAMNTARISGTLQDRMSASSAFNKARERLAGIEAVISVDERRRLADFQRQLELAEGQKREVENRFYAQQIENRRAEQPREDVERQAGPQARQEEKREFDERLGMSAPQLLVLIAGALVICLSVAAVIASLMTTRRARQNPGQPRPQPSSLGYVQAADQFIPVASVRAIEDVQTGVFTRKYWWRIHLFHEPPVDVWFRSPEEARHYREYLMRLLPGVPFIHREVQMSWWIRF